MCGIIGYVGPDEVVPVLLDGLRRLEYRGYDSAGMAVLGHDEIGILRAAGKLGNLEQKAYHEPLHGKVGIGHTRWATHGAPTEANAHPQTDSGGQVAVVHNGILENYGRLRHELLDAGVELQSDTDTELIAQLLGREEGSLAERVLAVLPRLEGQYAVVAVHQAEPDVVVAFRNGPPLVIGLGEEENLVASDVTALLHRTRRVVYLENGDIAEIRRDALRLLDVSGGEIERAVDTLVWDAARVEKGGYRHFMLKEIFEQPDAIRNTVRAYLDQERRGVNLDGLGFSREELVRLRRIHLVACGTSWHACLVGKFVLEELTGLPTEVDYASEYRYRTPLVGDDVLVIGVTQSGETADTLAAMEMAREAGALLATVCNVRGSSAWRLAPSQILTQAGPEIGVASTKAFTTQLVAMVLIALGLRSARGLADETDAELVSGLQRLPQAVERALAIDDEIFALGTEMLADATDSLYLGRGILYPIALEGALKLKEISYLHAEGYPAGEMKHGPIALLQEGFPVVAVVPGGTNRNKLISNLMEARARGAAVLAVADEDADEIADVADLTLRVPKVHSLLQPVVTVVPLQLLAYHVAVELGLDVDQPRNLAKSVTVE
ncbi:MAG: glutamine--fructose-6-phosphate transaminase (isomerizing) [Acidobacteria bacterium]|uniref:Glutamine--fructose-6-phosphate aminotransferase [isomerizing] n=1 Tax=Candidatus Sulfomarinibacter kjeldsenii TaxID=2885994 RepID=A0A8J6Y6B3_9BACT|nr:glutamine--fructose-6-phosphate transaminase (isomerizing) [Candidatus Sulfomarinibacter kjeldsenii]